MELKRYIESIAKVIIPSIDHLQLVEYKDKELDFAYGMQEYHTSFKRMFKQIIRIIFR
jgi:hypothetical protein|tara:strand:- start:1245 stop:1418 length:174 start_codon:yes stop_codon:yes gene_type:complete